MNRKNFRIAIGFVIAVLGLAGSTGFAATDLGARVREERQPRIVVPRDAATIQAAVDAVPNGGRIVVHAGVYEETVTVDGKIVEIVGIDRPQFKGAVPERIAEATESVGLITYVRGGGGLIKGINFIGGDVAVKGFDRSAPPGPLEIKDSTIQGSGRGILWGFSELKLNAVFITGTLWHGLSASHLDLLIAASSIDSAFGVGIYIKDAGLFNPAQIINTSAFANARGGILAVNSAVEVDHGVVFDNRVGNIRLLGSLMSVKDSIIDGALPTSGTGLFGDGVMVMPLTAPSTLHIENSVVKDSARAGISNFGSNVAIKDVLLKCNPFELMDQNISKDLFGPGLPAQDLLHAYDNQGGNACGCPVADGNCTSDQAGLEPAEPLDPGN